MKIVENCVPMFALNWLIQVCHWAYGKGAFWAENCVEEIKQFY